MAVLIQADLENLLQIDVGAEPDTTVAWYIDTAQGLAEDYCQRLFDYEAGRVETIDGTDRETIQVQKWPIVTLTSVVENGITLTANQNYRAYLADGLITRTAGGGRTAMSWRRQLQGIVVTYDGGYQVAQAGAGAVLPDGLKLALVTIVGRLFRQGAAFASVPAGSHGAESVTLQGVGSVKYRADSTVLSGVELTADEKAALDPYRSPGLV